MNKEAEYEVITPNNVETGMSVLAKAEIDMQIATAKKFPRSVRQFINDATEMVTLNEDVAASCNYGLPRGGKIIEGPSTRFAELIYSAWGNCRAGTRVVHEDTRFVTSQGICHDLQRNTMITVEVKRRITDSKGRTYNDDMIGVTGNAAASIALRNAILRVIPKAYWQPIYAEARRISMGDSKTLATRRADCIAFMQKFGVTLEMVLAKFELKGIEDITLEHLATLKACAVSIRDGAATAESLFQASEETKPEAKGNAAVKERIKKASAKNADPETGEIVGDAPQVAAENQPSDESMQSPPTPFNLQDYQLTTQAGIKQATSRMCEELKMMPEEARNSKFVEMGGEELWTYARRAGIGPSILTKLQAIGVEPPQ